MLKGLSRLLDNKVLIANNQYVYLFQRNVLFTRQSVQKGEITQLDFEQVVPGVDKCTVTLLSYPVIIWNVSGSKLHHT